MRLSTPFLSSLLLTCLSFGGAAAETAGGGFSLRGSGAQTCAALGEALASEHGAGTLELLAAWSAGYVTHANRTAAETFETMPVYDNRVVARLTASLCRSYPEAHVETVLASLLAALEPGAVSEPSEVITIAQGERRLSMLRGVFQAVQERLIAETLLEPGSADGQYGPKSRQALMAYQKSKGLPESGLPDAATLLQILVQS